MKKTGIVVLASLLALILGITGCGSQSVGVIGGDLLRPGRRFFRYVHWHLLCF